ncbi:MAG: tubulin-like doman-containing protein [Gemmataceae bacterium]
MVVARLNRRRPTTSRPRAAAGRGWLPPGMLATRLPEQTGRPTGCRRSARLALCDNRDASSTASASRSSRSVRRPAGPGGRDTGLGVRTNRPRAYVVAGLAGGTGSGMAIDLGFILKHELKAVGYRKPDAVGVLLAPPPDGLGRPAGAANTYAALTELGHFAAGRPYQVRFDPAEPPVAAADGPFTRAALVPLPKKPRSKYQEAAYGLAARGLLVELATPAGRAADAGRGPDPVAGPNGEPVVQLFGLHRLTWPRAELAAVATRRFAHHLLTQWAGKESAHLREPIDRWLTDEWEAKHLDGPAVLARLTAVARDALGGNPEGVFDAAADSLRPTSWLAGRIDPQAAAGVFDQLLKLVGKPVGEMDQPTALEAAIKEAAKGLTADAEAALSEITVKFIERPQYRLAGADEALAQVTARLTQTADRLEMEVAVLHRETVEAFARLFQVIGGMAGRRTSADALDAFKLYPVAKLRHAVTAAALGVYKNLLGTVPDFVRDVTQCRGRLAEMAGQVAAGGEGSGDPGPATLLLPAGCETVEEAADQFLTALTPDDFLEFDQAVQQEVKRRFRGVASVCQKPARVPDFLALLTAEARAYLTDRLETTDPAAALYRHRGADAGQVLRAGYEAAGPDLDGVAGRPAEVAVLAVPPGPAGDRVAALAAAACPGVSFTPARSSDDILIVRECPRVPLTALPQLGDDAREAYLAQQATDFPPHARADVRWS